MDLEIDGENFYRHRGIQLDGEDAPFLQEMWFEELPKGCYEARVALKRGGKVYRDKMTFNRDCEEEVV